MFKTKFMISTTIFITFLIITSVIKNKTRILEKQISNSQKLIIIKEKNKLYNRSVLIDPKGSIKTYYDKIHMYDAKLSSKEKYFESKSIFLK